MEERGAVEDDSDLFAEAETVPKERMRNTHDIGEVFSLNVDEDYSVKVTQVQVLDNIDVLDMSRQEADLREELLAETDADGNLLYGTMEYIKYGDGVDTLTQVVLKEEVPQKLVYITVDYTNIGEKSLTDVLFWGSLMRIAEDGDRVKIREGREPGEADQWDAARMKGAARAWEMYYYDVHGGERGNNYISSIEPGETVTVHLGWIVPEEELPYLYLNLDTTGGSCFSEEGLEIGYVDIRQCCILPAH